MARTEGQWIKGLDFITPHENVPVLLKNEYLNFGGFFIGETGFGIRNNAGVMEYKDESGAWTPFSAGAGGGAVELPATGTVNGINTDFTFSEEPDYIVADGVWFKKQLKNGQIAWTFSVLTATMVIPPSADIFGVKFT